MLTGDNGIIAQAQKAKTQTEKATAKEKVDLAIAASYDETGKINLEQLKNNLNNIEEIKTEIEDLTDNSFPLDVIVDGKNVTIIKDINENYCTSVEDRISKTESYVGYYADVDDDGIIDGVIYADLAKGDNVEKKWNNNSDSTYTIHSIDAKDLKEYKIKTSSFPEGVSEDIFKTGKTTEEVIVPTLQSSKLKSRFYIMALKDVTPNKVYYWYNGAYNKISDYNSTTSEDFGKGKENTDTMIEKWNNKVYDLQKSDDIWGIIQGKSVNDNGEVVNDETKTNYYAKGWYVPSRAEWSAFANELKIDETEYNNFGLNYCYWTSSLKDTYRAFSASFTNGGISFMSVGGSYCVRLGMNF